METDLLEQTYVSNEPKDISSRTLNSFENYLAQVTAMYYGSSIDQPRPLNEVSLALGQSSSSVQSPPVLQGSPSQPLLTPTDSEPEPSHFQPTTLDLLISPIRAPYTFEKWSPLEIAIFESALCKYGKITEIGRFLKTKTQQEINDFYFS